jgi:hypothetical protein
MVMKEERGERNKTDGVMKRSLWAEVSGNFPNMGSLTSILGMGMPVPQFEVKSL